MVEDARVVEDVLERREERGRWLPSLGKRTSGGSIAGVGVAAAEGRDGRPRIGSHDKGGIQQGDWRRERGRWKVSVDVITMILSGLVR